MLIEGTMKFFAILLLGVSFVSYSSSVSEKCGLGTGILCITQKDITRQYLPRINSIKTKLETINKISLEQIASSKSSVQKNIADAQSLTSGRLLEARKTLTLAKTEARQIPRLQVCLNGLSVELAKIPPSNFNGCFSAANFTNAFSARAKFVQLEQTLKNLINYCTAMNPFRSEFDSLRVCMETKLVDIEVQVGLIEKEFDAILRDTANLAVNCIMRTNSDANGKIGAVLSGIHTCKQLI